MTTIPPHDISFSLCCILGIRVVLSVGTYVINSCPGVGGRTVPTVSPWHWERGVSPRVMRSIPLLRTTSFNETQHGTINNFPLSSENISTAPPSSDFSLLCIFFLLNPSED
ncbi:hypothetical protein GWK47_039410 [Chionoecetes opilio]|uniref:Uncharacterized protein n=1 Tax=Chionoecetes opilio TaxID=41210 RepID=A0A8J4YLT0_CHIOP|nr:hypothetical protein GWK47_039410 [Chionoecetes opilio]